MAVYQDREGALWVGTSDGGVNRLKDGKITIYKTKDGLADNQVFSSPKTDMGIIGLAHATV